jgi:hypothetical protein
MTDRVLTVQLAKDRQQQDRRPRTARNPIADGKATGSEGKNNSLILYASDSISRLQRDNNTLSYKSVAVAAAIEFCPLRRHHDIKLANSDYDV